MTEEELLKEFSKCMKDLLFHGFTAYRTTEQGIEYISLDDFKRDYGKEFEEFLKQQAVSSDRPLPLTPKKSDTTKESN